MNLTSVREELAGLCTGALPDTWGVVDHLPDSIAPPMALISWGDPWLKLSTICAFEAVMEVILIAQRIEPGGKLSTLEEGVAHLLPAIRPSEFSLTDVTAPYPMQVGGVDYLACSINLTYDLGD